MGKRQQKEEFYCESKERILQVRCRTITRGVEKGAMYKAQSARIVPATSGGVEGSTSTQQCQLMAMMKKAFRTGHVTQ